MAANRIRGITVEIGGDTTKLDKALAGTNKNINSTQKALKDVERLLKLDPGNTTLLEQRQRLLAQSVEITREKLDTLRTAAQQADEALSRGKAYEEKYAPLREALTETKDQLKALRDQQEAMEAAFASGELSEEEYQAYNDTLKETEDRFASLKEAKKNLDAEFEGSKMNQEQYDNLQREIIETEHDLQELEEQADDTNHALGGIGEAAENISSTADKISNATRGLSLAAGGLLSSMLASVKGTEEFRSDLSKLETNAQQAGLGLESTENAMRQLNAVSDEVDSSVEALSNLLQAGVTDSNLQRAIENLAGAAIAFPDTIKIESLADSLQETLATGAATGQFAEVLERLGLSVDTFNYQLSQVPRESDKLNFALDTLQNQGLAGVYNAWTQNNEALIENKDASLEFLKSLADLAEKMQPLMTTITELASKFMDFFSGLDDGTRTAIVGLLGLIAGISPVAGAISNVSGAIKAVSDISSIFSDAAGNKVYLTFLKWSAIIIAVVTAVALLIALINILMGKGNDMQSAMSSISNTAGNISGSIGGAGSGYPPRQSLARLSDSASSLDSYPGFASGGVFAPNNPMLGVLGDNRTEYEVAAPESMLRETFLDALSSSGLMGRSAPSADGRTIVLNLDGRTFARLVMPYLKDQSSLMGINLLDK